MPTRIAILCALVVSSHAAVSQSIQEKFAKYRQQSAQEKLYVHTDRDLYLTGETLWLKIYSVDGALHRPSDLSAVAYIELIPESGTAAVQAKVSLRGGFGPASIFLPATMSSGNYQLRAYTRWMKNFDPGYFFQKKISIVNTFIRLDVPVKPTASIDARFFPEGGNLVDGVDAKVGFKVTDESGLGVACRGSIINERNDTLVRFQPLKFGMGNFTFTPKASSSYRAVITVKNVRKVFDLPVVAPTGYSLKAIPSADKLRVEVRTTGLAAGSVMVFVHSRHSVIKAEQTPLKDGIASLELNASQMPDGISHITVFDEGQRPVCERLYFKRPANPLNIQVTADKKEYGPRKEVTLDVKASQSSSLSMAVFRLDSLSNVPGNGILEYLWLSSDIKGNIESPEFYFGTDQDAAAGADNLMLTQGWRRFKWTEVMAGPPARTFAPEYQGHIVEGTVKNRSGEVVNDSKTYLSSPDKVINTYSARSTKDGKVIYALKNLYGPRKLVMYADSSNIIQLESPFLQGAPELTLPSFMLNKSAEKDLLARSIWMQVKDIYFESKDIPVRFDSTAFYGQPDEKYLLDDYTRFPVMEEILREYVPGVMVRKNRDGFHFLLTDATSKKIIQSSPTILIDGVPVFDVNKVMSFDPLRVSKLDVVSRSYYHGTSVYTGLLSFTTYDGDLGGFPLGEGYVTIDYDGLNLQREFYSPNYSKNNKANLPDQRSLLYWNPDISATATGTSLKFHTSDLDGKYVVIVEGLSFESSAGRAIAEFTVTKSE